MSLRKTTHIKILFYKDAPRNATVSSRVGVSGIVGHESIGLRINGKPDAGTDVDLGNQLLLAHLPLLVKPAAKDVFVLGMGSGVTAGAALAYPIERLDIAEKLRAGYHRRKHFCRHGIATCWTIRARMSGVKTPARCSSCIRKVTM